VNTTAEVVVVAAQRALSEIDCMPPTGSPVSRT
jgi:hypothetical protein